MARSLNIVIGANIEKLRQGLNDAVTAIQSSGQKMSASTAETAKKIEEKLALIATKNPTAGTVRQLTNLAMEARSLGPEFNQVANQIIKEAGRIKDSIGDARAEVGYFASDTRRLDAVLGGIQGVAGAFSAVQGATALFGAENEDLQKTMVKLQGAMALVNGVTAIQNALQAESAFMVGLQTAATRLQTYVMGQATVAARVYSAALLATGAGVIIAGLALVYSALEDNADAAEKAEKAQKKYSDEIEASNNRALKFFERQIKFREEQAIKEGQIAGKSQQQIEAIELDYINKKIAGYKKMQSGISIDAELYHELTQKIQEAENAAILKGLDIKVNASSKGRAQREKDIKKEHDAAIKAIHDRHAGEQAADDFLVARHKAQRERAAEKIKAAKELNGTNLIAGTAVAPILIQVAIDPASRTQIVQDFNKLVEGISAAVEVLGEDIAVSFGEAIGGALSGQRDVMANLGDAVLTSLGQFMSKVGKMLIAYAISIEKLKTAFAKPQEALIAGIALVAIGSLIANSMKQGPSVTAFAEGGIVSGPTLGLMGEYPGAKSNPEVIAPLDKLKGMLNNNDSSGFVASTTIQGRDLALVIERYNTDSRRG